METLNEFAPRYPWDEWLDGQVRKAVRGIDFKISATNFRYTLRAAANRRGLKIRTKVHGDEVTFQTWTDDDTEGDIA